MSYNRLNLKNGQKWTQDHIAHLENGIVANENELAKKALKTDIPDISNLQPKGDYALRKDIPDVSNFTTHKEVQDLINAIEMPEGASGMIALTEEEILNICKF